MTGQSLLLFFIFPKICLNVSLPEEHFYVYKLNNLASFIHCLINDKSDHNYTCLIMPSLLPTVLYRTISLKRAIQLPTSTIFSLTDKLE